MSTITTGRIDVHSHLLPGVDDGCATVDESLQCARMLVEFGYTHAFCTPHIWPSLPGNTVTTISAGVESLQHALDQQRIPLRVLPGGEIGLLAMWPALETFADDQIVTYSLAGRFVLFDFWAASSDCLAD